MTNRPLRVFLCHSSNDKPAVRELYQKLCAEAWIQPWLDEEELYPGQDWNMEIEKAVETADAIIVCLTKNSINKEGYVQRELRTVLDFADYKPEGTLYIIPVRLEECEPPRRLRVWQYADYFEGQHERAFERLLVSLKRRADLLGLKIEGNAPKDKSVDKNKPDAEKPKTNQKNTESYTIPLDRPKYSHTPKKIKSDSQQVKEQRLILSKFAPSQTESSYYPNKFGLIILKTLEETIGKDSLHAVLRLAGLENYIENYPLDNLDKHFGFAEVSAICSALEEFYGSRGGRGFALRAGRAIFSEMLKNYGALASGKDLAFTVLPLNTKLRIGLPALAKVFTQISDQMTTVEEKDTELIWTIHNCPYCWDRSELDKPICYMFIGLLQESLNWFSGGREFRVNETKCKASGDQICEFVIQKNPIG